MNPRSFHDRLYGQVGFSDFELKVFQTDELSRIRQISLSAVPPWVLPTGVCASRFEHSVGVAHLSKIVAERDEFEEIKDLLYFACLCHDIGSPPFSHASEGFQGKVLGKQHEEFVADVLDGSELAKLIESRGVDVATVVAWINGDDEPFSDLVNGSIDLDNLDNTLRFGLSMGLINKMYYDPQKLATYYSLVDGELVLLAHDTTEIEQWEWVRKRIYNYVYSPHNLSTGMILYRALDYAFQENELAPEFFLYTDPQAFNYLLEKCNSRTRYLMAQAKNLVFYKQAWNYASTNPSRELKEFCSDMDNRRSLSDRISQEFGIKPEHVSVYSGKNKGHKRIHLPFVSLDETQSNIKPTSQETYMVQVYIHPSEEVNSQALAEFMSSSLEISNEG